MNTILEILGLDLNQFNKNVNGEYEYTMSGVGEFGRLYAKLDNAEDIQQEINKSALTTDRSTITFESTECTIRLQSDFDTDEYNLVIIED